jgi:hypothetical protein
MLPEPACYRRKCRFFQGVRYLGEGEETEVIYCAAFPDGIPEEIANGDDLHDKSVKGDHGITFEQG